MYYLLYLCIVVGFLNDGGVYATTATCPCGFYDPSMDTMFTHSMIVYFNETTSVPIPGFVIEDYRDHYEKGWVTQFRQGASPSNVGFSNSSSNANRSMALDLQVSPYQPDHLVMGGGIRSSRRDIQYGSFTALLRSPGANAGEGGSVLSMMLKFNMTQKVSVNLQNRNVYTNASVSILHGDEPPDPSRTIPYERMTNGTFGNDTIIPWENTEFQIVWVKDYVKVYIGGYLARTILETDIGDLFSVPSPFQIKHWSNGDENSSQGPPKRLTNASLGWTRTFFNSSLMTEHDHLIFDKRCHIADACLSSDTRLRESSPIPEEALVVWRQKPIAKPRRAFAIWLAVSCIAMMALLLLEPLWKLVRGKLPIRKKFHNPRRNSEKFTTMSASFDPRATLIQSNMMSPAITDHSSLSSPTSVLFNKNVFVPTPRKSALRKSAALSSGRQSTEVSIQPHYDGSGISSAPRPHSSPSASCWVDNIGSDDQMSSQDQHIDVSAESPRKSVFFEDVGPARQSSVRHSPNESDQDIPKTHKDRTILEEDQKDEATLKRSKRKRESRVTFTEEVLINDSTSEECDEAIQEPRQRCKSVVLENDVELSETMLPVSFKKRASVAPSYIRPGSGHSVAIVLENGAEVPEAMLLDSKGPPSTISRPPTTLPEAKERIDHLAGLLTIMSLLVTARNFSLTFVSGDLIPGAFAHYRSEEVTRKTSNQIVLNLIGFGPFLMTSTRFLVTSYLRTGDLLHIAKKIVQRTFRLMIPVTAVVALQYFLIESGTTKWLEYLPSVTWSTWPFVVGFGNFGKFLSGTLDLAYLIPNGAPAIIVNFCTGVLWTIPIQLQGSWQTLLAVIVIYEIKVPWKRFGLYAFCMINHWYAVSWGTYFYLGIMLTDLDITYNWRKLLYARPLAYYALLLFFVMLTIAALGLDVITQWTNVSYVTYEYGIHPDPSTGSTLSQAGLQAYPEYYVPRINGIAFAVGLQAVIELSPLVQKLLSFKFLTSIFPHIFTIYLFHGLVFWAFGSWLCITLAIRGLSYRLNILVVAICCYAILVLLLPLFTPVMKSLGKDLPNLIWESAHLEPAPRKPTLYPFPPGFLFDRYEVPAETPRERIRDSRIVVVSGLKDPEP